MDTLPAEFEGQSILRSDDEASETWWFSVVDVVQVLTQQQDDLTAHKYLNQLRRRLSQEGSQLESQTGRRVVSGNYLASPSKKSLQPLRKTKRLGG